MKIIDKKNTALYRVIWRWHFYAGLFCIPFVIMLSISGAIYLFKPQINAWMDAPYQRLQPVSERAEPNEHIQTAISAVPGSQFYNYRLPRTQNSAVVVSVFRGGQRTLVYVNPYTLEVIKITPYADQFVQWVKRFHGQLLMGDTGSVLVELAACWAIVLIVTGLYLWWPRTAKGMAGVLYPRLHLKGRLFWKDIHAVVGMWISMLALFLLISGLPWALVWGSAFKEIRKFNETTVQQDWSVSKKELAKSWESNAVSSFDLTPELYSKAKALQFAHPAELSVSDEANNIWKLSSINQNRPLRSDAWLDGESAQVQRLRRFGDRKVIDQVIGIGVAAHEGQLFGWFNQLLGLLTSAGLVVVSASGFVLWRKRKPEKKLGAPPAILDSSKGNAVTVIVFALALLMPLLLISLIALLLFEYCVMRKIPRLRDWLGFSA